MSKISKITSITQELNNLSLKELLEVKQNINRLVERKLSAIQQSGVTNISLPVMDLLDIPCDALLTAMIAEEIQQVYLHSNQGQSVKPTVTPDSSLEKVIEMTDEWLADESEYDAIAYHQIEEGLKQNQQLAF
ncbi:hypothetical protein CLI64_26295 [Nostoc sp. CENA543]|uniref:hypothetical protein n=1 Tax=Nostoc sp. CENA543 TaxID=1869241 RepID=UPI000CA252AE|nr:hypothetical protein [Nostoc sp. CENA543]AUT03632.1 hypothetical protein CLI64_26295 [Nostoc sp. CENA543]